MSLDRDVVTSHHGYAVQQPEPRSTIASTERPRVKILQILYFYSPYTSGVTIYAERMSRELTAHGHQVTVLASQHEDDQPREETVDDVRIVRVPVMAGFDRAVIMPTLIPTAARLMRQHDVVHLHLPMAEAAALSAIGRALGCRVIVTHHSDLVLTTGPVEKLAAGVARWSGIAAARVSNQLVTYTHDRAAVSPTVTRAGKKVTIVPPPITINATSAAQGAAFREQHHLGDGPVVGFAGRFAIEKGIDVLLKTLPILQKRWPNVAIAMIGPDAGIDGVPWKGPWDALIEKAGPAARKLGILTGQDLADYYAAIDVLVLPSINWTETFGLVQVEAMLCGTPVVASDLPGVREPALLTGMGTIAPPGDVNALAAAIADVIANRNTYVKPAAEIEARFSLPVTIDAYERLYRGEPVELSRPGPWTGLASATDIEPSDTVETDRVQTARDRVRNLMPVEGDLAFRRRCETILEWLDPAPGARVLDAGCGYGFTLRMLAELTDAELVGLDFAPERVEQVQRDLARFPNVSVVQGDAQALPFDDASFDHVVCSEVLEHLPDDAAAVREILRVLKPGGTAVFTVPDADFPFTWDPPNWLLKRLGGIQLKGERPWSGIWYGHRRLYAEDQLATLLRTSGFEVVAERPLAFRTPPFAHLLLYGIGKPLLQSGLVPAGLRKQADRVSTSGKPGFVAGKAMQVLEAIDAPNDDPARVEQAREFVAIAALVRKPQ